MEMEKCIASPKTPATPASAPARVSEGKRDRMDMFKWYPTADAVDPTWLSIPSGQMQFAIASMPIAIRIVVRHSAAILIQKTEAKPSKML